MERSRPPSRSTELEIGEERGVREEAPGAVAEAGGGLIAPTPPGGGGRRPAPPLARGRDLSLFGMLMFTWEGKRCSSEIDLGVNVTLIV